jgi:hypothetical protein
MAGMFTIRYNTNMTRKMAVVSAQDARNPQDDGAVMYAQSRNANKAVTTENNMTRLRRRAESRES